MHRYILNEDDPGGHRLRGCQQGGVAVAGAKGLDRNRADPGFDLHPPVVRSLENGQERPHICENWKAVCVVDGGGATIYQGRSHICMEKQDRQKQSQSHASNSLSNFNTDPLWISPCRLHCPNSPEFTLWTCAHMVQTTLVAGGNNNGISAGYAESQRHHIIQEHELGFTFSDIKVFPSHLCILFRYIKSFK